MASGAVDAPTQAFIQLLADADEFRVAIRAHTNIDELLTAGIAEAFKGRMPGEIRRLPFRTKLELAIALELVIPEMREPILKLTKIRNEFAHGATTELDAGIVDATIVLLDSFIPDTLKPQLDGMPTLGKMKLAYLVVRFIASINAEQRRSRERELHDALAEKRRGDNLRALIAGSSSALARAAGQPEAE